MGKKLADWEFFVNFVCNNFPHTTNTYEVDGKTFNS